MVITTTTLVINEMKKNNEIIMTDNEIRIITSDYATIITTAQALEDLNYEIKVKLKSVQFQNKLVMPEILFEDKKIIVGLLERDKNFFEYVPSKNNLEKQNNFLVIRNE